MPRKWTGSVGFSLFHHADERVGLIQAIHRCTQLEHSLEKFHDSVHEKKTMIKPGHLEIPVSRQCELMGLSRAAGDFRPREGDARNETLMRLLDEQYTKTPFYGVPKTTAWRQCQGYKVNRKRVRRLMRLMGLEAVYPTWLSKPAKDHKRYPYLLKDVILGRPDHVRIRAASLRALSLRG